MKEAGRSRRLRGTRARLVAVQAQSCPGWSCHSIEREVDLALRGKVDVRFRHTFRGLSPGEPAYGGLLSHNWAASPPYLTRRARLRRSPVPYFASGRGAERGDSSTGVAASARIRTSRQDTPSRISAGRPKTTAVTTSTACRMMP